MSKTQQFYVYLHCYVGDEPFNVNKEKYHSVLANLDVLSLIDVPFIFDILNGVIIPFYAGKGIRNRAYQFDEGRRNKKWRNFVKKHAMKEELVLVFDMKSEDHAFRAEEKLIWLLRDKFGLWLANQTDGGEGPSGYKQSEEMKWKRANSHRGRKNTPETLERMRLAALARTNVYHHTEETKKIIGEASRRQVPYKRTPEIIEKMVAKKKGIPSPKKGKPGVKHTDKTKAQMKESQRARRAREALLK
jgi:hypothetical protein